MLIGSQGHGYGGHNPGGHNRQYPHSYVESTMCRTYNPGYASYTGDGSGRDAYIILNNGGLTRLDKGHMQVPKKFGGSRDISPKPFKPTPTFKYQSDGSGRDSYVIKNGGGLVRDFRGGRADSIFVGTLRDSIKSNVRSSTDNWRGPEITDFLNWTTPKVQAQNRKAVVRQKLLVDRLSPTPMRESARGCSALDSIQSKDVDISSGFKSRRRTIQGGSVDKMSNNFMGIDQTPVNQVRAKYPANDLTIQTQSIPNARRTDGFESSGFRQKKKLNLFNFSKQSTGDNDQLMVSATPTHHASPYMQMARARNSSQNPDFIKRMPFVSTVTNGESKSRQHGNRLTSTANALMFDHRKKSMRMTAPTKRATTQLGGKLPELEEDEKRKILENACKLSNKRVSVDNYLASVLRREKTTRQANESGSAKKEAESAEAQARDLIQMLDI